jgi:DnaK suppressor protein
MNTPLFSCIGSEKMVMPMPGRVKAKKKTMSRVLPRAGTKRPPPDAGKSNVNPRSNGARTAEPVKGKAVGKPKLNQRSEFLHRMLMAKRQEVLREIGNSLGQSLTEDQQRRLESAMDVGDQALMDLEREMGISLLEMRNRKRQMIDEALTRLHEGTYGICAECGIEISEKRLAAVPFAKLCVDCQARQELIEKIEKGEERD